MIFKLRLIEFLLHLGRLRKVILLQVRHHFKIVDLEFLERILGSNQLDFVELDLLVKEGQGLGGITLLIGAGTVEENIKQ